MARSSSKNSQFERRGRFFTVMLALFLVGGGFSIGLIKLLRSPEPTLSFAFPKGWGKPKTMAEDQNKSWESDYAQKLALMASDALPKTVKTSAPSASPQETPKTKTHEKKTGFFGRIKYAATSLFKKHPEKNSPEKKALAKKHPKKTHKTSK